MKAVRWYGLWVLLSWPWLAAAQVLEHGGSPPQLIELYTSEGCSSCPPADARLATLLEHPGLWQRVVPLAFHVDYWDYLGWEDRFAAPAHSRRQRQLYRAGQLKAVYTPAWLIDGQEWRGFFHQRDWPEPVQRRGGSLRAELNGNMLHVRYSGRWGDRF